MNVINSAKSVKNEVVEKMSNLITSGFGLVAALAWNDAIKSVLLNNPHLAKYGSWAYAVIVTVIAVTASIWIGKLSQKAKGEDE